MRPHHKPRRKKWWTVIAILNATLWFVTVMVVVLLYVTLPLEHHTRLVVANSTVPFVYGSVPAPLHDVQHYHFTLRDKPRSYQRYYVKQVDRHKTKRYDLCCHVDSYLVCNTGQGRSSNMELECLLGYDDKQRCTYILVWAGSHDLSGADCVLTWETSHHRL